MFLPSRVIVVALQHIDMLDAQRRTALHEAVKVCRWKMLLGGILSYSTFQAKSTECIASLLASKANVLSADRGGKTCLHMAAFIGYFQGMKQLVDAGLPVDTPSNNGNTALHVAAHLGHPRCTKYVISDDTWMWLTIVAENYLRLAQVQMLPTLIIFLREQSQWHGYNKRRIHSGSKSFGK